MTDPKWFRLVIRAVGVLTIAISIPHVGGAIASLAMMLQAGPGGWRSYLSSSGAGGGESWWNPFTFGVAASVLAAAGQLGLGLYLLCGASRLVRYCVREVSGRCAGCDYEVRGLKGKCPECGLEIPEAAPPRQA
jgi:hypothetical protein